MKNHLKLGMGEGSLDWRQRPCATAPEAPATGEKPNFVFILMDDMGYADLSCYGETRWQDAEHRLAGIAGHPFH